LGLTGTTTSIHLLQPGRENEGREEGWGLGLEDDLCRVSSSPSSTVCMPPTCPRRSPSAQRRLHVCVGAVQH
jgi:hypothetical protein